MSVYREKRVFKWFGICRDGEQGLKNGERVQVDRKLPGLQND